MASPSAVARHAAALLLLPLGALGAAPQFSWDTLPVFYHSSIQSGVPNATALATIARYPLVTIEKYQGPLRSAAFHAGKVHQEDNIAAMAKAIKAISPDVAVLSYMHMNNYPWYNYYWDMEAQPGWWSAEKVMMVNLNCSDGSTDADPYPPACPKIAVPARDWNSSAAAAAYAAACSRQVAAGVDGCFVDGTDGGADVAGFRSALATMQAQVAPGVVIANGRKAAGGAFHPAVGGAMLEQFVGNEGAAKAMQASAQMGMVFEAHAKNCPPLEMDVATFLLAAEENSYFGCGPWFESAAAWPTGKGAAIGSGPHWFGEFYDKPLGAPTGAAVVAGKVWKRAFASGTTVTVDYSTNEATINWAAAPAGR